LKGREEKVRGGREWKRERRGEAGRVDFLLVVVERLGSKKREGKGEPAEEKME